MVWVKFHDTLRRGAKRGLPRAVRFVYLELCLEARPGRGVMTLPVGMSDLDALHDVLGGNRKEIVEALKLLTIVPAPTPEDPLPRAMVELHGEPGTRRLVIPAWETWNTGQEAPGASTTRSRKHRQQRGPRGPATEPPEDGPWPPADDGNDDGTAMQRPLHDDATDAPPVDATGATAPRGEESRREKRREDQAHTQSRASAHAREDADHAPAVGAAPITTTESLLAAVEQHEMLATLHGDERWAMRAVGPLQASACRAEDATAAVNAFVADSAAQAPQDGPLLDDFVRGGIGPYLKRAKEHGDAARARAARGSDRGLRGLLPPDARRALEVFAEAWQKCKGAPYVASEGDEEHAAALVALARPHAKQANEGSAIVRHWADRYLADKDAFVADKEHPLRLLPSRVGQYGLPRGKKSERPTFAPVPEPPAVPPTAEQLAALTGQIGTGALGRPARCP